MALLQQFDDSVESPREHDRRETDGSRVLVLALRELEESQASNAVSVFPPVAARDLVHEVDYASWIFGWPKAVYARLRNLGRLGIEAEEAADLIWETAEGCLVSMSLDYLSKPPRRRMRATGERGILEWDGIANTVSLTTADGPPDVKGSSQTWEEMFLEQDRAFINLAHGCREPRLATGEEGVNVLAICDAGRRSSQSRKEELVEYS